MRAVVDGMEFEGTQDEILAFVRAYREGQPLLRSTAEPLTRDQEKVEAQDERFASEKIAYRALRRRPLSAAQRDLFRTLLVAYPDWVSATQLQKATGYNANQLGGLLGAIGRRLSQTEGYVRNSSLIEWMWDADESEYNYRLPPSVSHAVRRISP